MIEKVTETERISKELRERENAEVVEEREKERSAEREEQRKRFSGIKIKHVSSNKTYEEGRKEIFKSPEKMKKYRN